MWRFVCEPTEVGSFVADGEGVGGEVDYATVTPDRVVPRHRLSTDTNSSGNFVDFTEGKPVPALVFQQWNQLDPRTTLL